MVSCHQVKANVLLHPVPPRASLHSALACDIVGALVMPCHVNHWPRTALEPLEMDHTVLFSLKYLPRWAPTPTALCFLHYFLVREIEGDGDRKKRKE